MKFRIHLLLAINVCLLLCHNAYAGKVDTASIYSPSMHRNIKCVVVLPDAYKKKSNHFPVVYLLHGYSGNYSNWIVKEPLLKKYANDYQLIIACPDGAFGSWFFDSPLDSNYRYETYVAKEVPAFIDSAYRTISERNARAITGLSMGGHGAMWLSFRHADVFGAAASMSGGVDLMESVGKFDISKRLGDTSNWHGYSVLNAIEQKPSDSLALLFDCGINDIFIEGNRSLHRKMLQLKITHDYTERPGAHNWDYWKASLPYHLLFFRRYFDAMLNKNT